MLQKGEGGNGTGSIKWGGGWEGVVEEGTWGGITNPKALCKSQVETFSRGILKHVHI